MMQYHSGFAQLIEKYVNFRKASESWSEGYQQTLQAFDRYCAENHPGKPLCQEMINIWCAKRNTETNDSCRTRTKSVRSFLQYLKKRGLTDVEPAVLPKADKVTHIPYAFSYKELKRFFYECDHMIARRPIPKFMMPKMTCPVFFRLLYSSGIRITEARFLQRSEVNLKEGVLNIRKSKGYNQHYVALHENMLSLMRQYDHEIDKIHPDRTYFFESANGTHYSVSWLNCIFRSLWEKANGIGKRPVAYDFRHNYAIENINNWNTDIFESSDKLHYLSKSMGHSSIESTLYYYSIIPALADTLITKTEADFNEIIPEVPNEKEYRCE